MTTRRATLLWVILTAAVAAGRASPASAGLPTTGQVVELSPFMVSGTRIPWRYEALPGYEILSSYPDSVTRDFVLGLDHARRLVHAFVPDNLLASFDVPHATILSDPDLMSSLSQGVLQDGSGRENWHLFGIRSANGRQVFPNMELNDRDRTVAFVSRLDRTFQPASEKTGDGRLRFLLERRTPPLPRWFVAGIMNLYSGVAAVAVDTGAVKTRESHSSMGPSPRVYEMDEMDSYSRRDDRLRTDGSYEGVVSYRIPVLTWISPAETKALGPRQDGFCPDGTDKASVMKSLLEEDPPEEPGASQLWNARAALFVRWGLYGGDRPGKRAFWEFVAQAAAERATEAVFRNRLGMSYAWAASRLNDYLPGAVEEPVDLQLEPAAGFSPRQLRQATPAEVARMKGEWERLALVHVTESYSDSESGFIKAELTRACALAPHDSRLLSVLGLFDCDSGAGTDGERFLEAAVKAGVPGPRVYYELAELRYKKVRGPGDIPLSAADAAHVIEPLEAGQRQSPALREDYELMEKVWSHSEARLSRQQWALFDAGLEKFPKDLDLLYQVAVVSAANGYRNEAAAEAERGLQRSSAAEDQDRFSKLLAETAKAMESGPGK